MDFSTTTDTDLDALRVEVLIEQERRQNLATLPAQAAAIATAYEHAVGTPDPVAWDGDTRPTYLWGPGVIVTHQGKTWRNGTGAFLNGHYIPGDAMHPFWTELPGEEETATPFTTGMPLTKGMLVTHLGKTFRYLGTGNPSAPANWAPTRTDATWQLIE